MWPESRSTRASSCANVLSRGVRRCFCSRASLRVNATTIKSRKCYVRVTPNADTPLPSTTSSFGFGAVQERRRLVMNVAVVRVSGRVIVSNIPQLLYANTVVRRNHDFRACMPTPICIGTCHRFVFSVILYPRIVCFYVIVGHLVCVPIAMQLLLT